MGALRGDTSILSAADLFQHLASTHKHGTLGIQQGDHVRTLYLGPDGIRLVRTTSARTTSLGEILIRTRKITRQELNPLLEEQKKTGKRLGELVARLGKVSKQDIQHALREQVEEEIFDIFSWSEATFEFVEGPLPAPPLDNPMFEVVLEASPTSILLEASRRADEMSIVRKVVRDESLIPFRTTKPFQPNHLGLSPDLLSAVYAELNARASVAEVVRRSLYPRFDALRAMYVLLSKGYAQLVDREGATVLILEHESKKQSSTATRKIFAGGKCKAILLLGDMLKYRTALASLLRATGHEVIEEVASGMVGLLARKDRIDLVILDVSINIDDGFVFCAWLRDNLRLPIIVLSADPSREAGLRALEHGAKAYVVKPFTSEVILRTVTGLLHPSAEGMPSVPPA